MKYIPLTAALVAASLAMPALAQDEASSAPRLEPYVGVMGGMHLFDNEQYKGAPPAGYKGWLVEGVAGLNYNLGPVVVGVEGSVAKGVDKDIDWEYGAAGRIGLKAGKDSMFFAKVGYQWTQFNDKAIPAVPTDEKFDGVTYGFGAEVSLADLGSSAERSNVRLRAQVDTRGDFHSVRPMAGVVMKF
jgi:outer membrane immunogenic protein